MKYLIITLLSLSSVFAAENTSLPSDHEIPLIYTEIGKTQEGYFLTIAELLATPSWNPKSGAPAPLSIESAIQLGLAEIKKRNLKYSEFDVVNITINPVNPDLVPNRWFYSMRFCAAQDGNRLYLSSISETVIVLFDKSIPNTKKKENGS